MTVQRFPYPACLVDPAYKRCAQEAVANAELVSEFERLWNCSLAADGDDAMRAFSQFVHADIYMRLPDDSIVALRAPVRVKG